MKVRTISIPGDGRDLSEDFWIVEPRGCELYVAVGDWASNLDGLCYSHKNVNVILGLPESTKIPGGVIGAQIAKQVLQRSKKRGPRLIREINEALRNVYQELGILEYEEDRSKAFTGYIASVHVNSTGASITAVGDVRVALDNEIITGRTKEIDIEIAQERARYIAETGDVEGSWSHILPQLRKQFEVQNNPKNRLGYWAIDGAHNIPGYSIDYILHVGNIQRVLIWTDGFLTPDTFTIEGLSSKLEEAYEVDPNRCREYPAVKSKKDDRTAIEVIFDGNPELEFEEVLRSP